MAVGHGVAVRTGRCLDAHAGALICYKQESRAVRAVPPRAGPAFSASPRRGFGSRSQFKHK